jgi:hypothetical protein
VSKLDDLARAIASGQPIKRGEPNLSKRQRDVLHRRESAMVNALGMSPDQARSIIETTIRHDLRARQDAKRERARRASEREWSRDVDAAASKYRP